MPQYKADLIAVSHIRWEEAPDIRWEEAPDAFRNLGSGRYSTAPPAELAGICLNINVQHSMDVLQPEGLTIYSV